MAGVTEELRVLVEAEVERAIAQFQKLDKTVEKNEKQTQKLGDALDALSRKSMVVSAAFGGAGIASIKFAGELEKTQKSLEVLLRDAEKATKIKDEWVSLAAETPFQTEDIDKAGKMLLAFGVGADKVTDSLRQIGDISSATGSSISELADLYGKAKVQGRLFAQDINQFQGRGIPIVQALAKQLDVAESSVRQMVEAGKIGFPEIEKAFKSMTDPGGQFAGLMKELSETTLGKFSTATDNAKLAMASFGEVLLPVANDVLDAATSIFQSIQEMDDGTKRFIITFGGVIVASGPIIFAIHSINAAMAALAANPALLAVVGTVAAIALIAGAIGKYNNQLQDNAKKMQETAQSASRLFNEYAGLDKAKTLDGQTTENLIKLYPRLKNELVAYKTTVAEAEAAVKKLTDAETQQLVRGQVNGLSMHLRKIQQEMAYLVDAGEAYTGAQKEFSKQFAQGVIDADTYKYELEKLANETNVLSLNTNITETKEQFTKALADINKKIAGTGRMLNESLQIVDIPMSIKINTEESNIPDSVKKTWQQWFEEITNVSAVKFRSSGEKAGTLYVKGLELSLSKKQSIATLLGDTFNLSEALKEQQDEIRKTLTEIFNIDPGNIDDAFTTEDSSVLKMIEAFRSLNKEINELDYADAVTELQTKIKDLTRSEEQLAASAHIAKGKTEEQARVLYDLNNEYDNANIIKEYEQRVKELGVSQEELARSTLVAKGATDQELEKFDEAIKKIKEFDNATKTLTFEQVLSEKIEKILDEWGKFDKKANKTLASLSTQLVMTFADFPLDALEGIGIAFAQSADAGDALSNSIAGAAQQMLNNLPTMFMQAGLSLVTQGQWALGLGLLAAAGASSFFKGYVNETKKQEQNKPRTEASDTNVQAFAKGGVFTNSIVDSPTFFKFAKGAGLMGEAGPEAVVPLTRTAGGDLGIRAEGFGESRAVTVIIYNNTGKPAESKETQREDGSRQIEITIGSMINSHLSSGRADKALSGRYGLKSKGV